MNRNLVSNILTAILALSCYLPQFYLFTDTFILPKFYLLLVSVNASGNSVNDIINSVNINQFINKKIKKQELVKKKFNFCGIFSTMFVAATIFSVSSCSQDDDYYESDMYTMAEPLETRAAEPGEGNHTYTRVADMGEILVPFTSKGSSKVLAKGVHCFIISDDSLKTFSTSARLVNEAEGHITYSTAQDVVMDSVKVTLTLAVTMEDTKGKEWSGGYTLSCLYNKFK